VSDEGFDFQPPPPRREARRFEPPPWERDAFERHAREQAEREAAAQEARAKVLAEEESARAAEAAEGAQASAAEPDEAVVARLATEAPRDTVVAPATEVSQPAASAQKAEVDEKQVAVLMLGLRAEEPAALEGVWVVSMAAGGVVALIGFAALIWGGAALARPGLPAAGTLGGVVLLGLGLGFLGVGAWLIFRALQQRGVL